MIIMLGIGLVTTLAWAQEPPQGVSFPDDGWRLQELKRAEKLITQHDFSPVQEAFEKRDLPLLWSYYLGSYSLTFQLSERATAEGVENLKAVSQERAERMQVALERSELAGGYLRQIPGHARIVGNLIEKTLVAKAGGPGMRRTYLESLIRLGQEGSDETIEQLGRFLFDERDPGFRPYDPSQPKLSEYDTRGVRNPMGNSAASSLLGVLMKRYPIGKALMDGNPSFPALVPDYADKLRQWWLTSDEAAPYRRSLADSGVVLPPGYPPMKELQGAKSTIAPPVTAPPPQLPKPAAPLRPQDASASPAKVREKDAEGERCQAFSAPAASQPLILKETLRRCVAVDGA